MIFREELCKKYLPKYYEKDKNDEIEIYHEYQKLLNSLINEIEMIEKSTKIEYNELNSRQYGCIQRCSREFVYSGWKDNVDKYRQAIYEITDFIYYPGFEYNDLALNEIKIIKQMASYLIFKANEFIYELEKNEKNK